MIHDTKEVDFKLLQVSSSAFGQDDLIPVRYTCDGFNISPPLHIEFIPEKAKSLAIIVDDPDAPAGTWVHWLIWNIPVTHDIKENDVHGTEGVNDFLQHHYAGPCPPSGTHHYHFKVYALNSVLTLPPSAKKLQLEKDMSEHIIAFGELQGLYKRK